MTSTRQPAAADDWDGQMLFFGRRGFSGEIGHCPVVQPGPPCGCGRLGCLETVASAKAIVSAEAGGEGIGRRSAMSTPNVEGPSESDGR